MSICGDLPQLDLKTFREVHSFIHSTGSFDVSPTNSSNTKLRTYQAPLALRAYSYATTIN